MDILSPVDGVPLNLVNGLENTLLQSLNIQDIQKLEHTSDDDTKFTNKSLNKSVTFPYPDMLPPSSSDEEDEEADTPLPESSSGKSTCQNYSRSISLPTPLKLVSAMKGSREKQGASGIKLTVKWAPDVYDPTPTSSSHTVKGKKHQKSKNNRKNEKKNDKKNGKKGQKANFRGGSGKDKRQSRKSGNELDVGSRDCGSSYLKNSVTRMHFSVAEV